MPVWRGGPHPPSPAIAVSAGLSQKERRRLLPPLPVGEGWGEGVPRSRKRVAAVLVAVAGAALAGCTPFAANAPGAPQTTVFPVSDIGGIIQDLYEVIFWMALAVFIGVEGFLLYTVVRFRRRTEGEMPAQVHGNTRLEVAWTIIPSVVLLVIAVPTIRTIFLQDEVPVARRGDVLKVRVIGHQWWWEFRYPDYGPNAMVANELHLPVGRTTRFELQSADVVHSFWIPKMGGKMDVVPTRITDLWYTPQQTGEFYGQCVEFCGIQHANMRLRLFVDTPEEFEQWLQGQAADAATPTGELGQRGAALFQGAQCPACHTIRGTRAQGTAGPDLTHVGSRTTIGSGLLQNSYENLARWIQDPQAVKVGNKMPNLQLNPSDVWTLAAYLSALR